MSRESEPEASSARRLEQDRRQAWDHLDIPFDRLVFAPPPSRWSRFWLRFRPVRMFGPLPRAPDVPLNIDPCTGGLLGGLNQIPTGSCQSPALPGPLRCLFCRLRNFLCHLWLSYHRLVNTLPMSRPTISIRNASSAI